MLSEILQNFWKDFSLIFLHPVLIQFYWIHVIMIVTSFGFCFLRFNLASKINPISLPVYIVINRMPLEIEIFTPSPEMSTHDFDEIWPTKYMFHLNILSGYYFFLIVWLHSCILFVYIFCHSVWFEFSYCFKFFPFKT